MRVVLRRVLERCVLQAADSSLDETSFRGITLAPKNGVRVVLERSPGPAREAEAAAAPASAA
jgi:hypothetical protein